MAQIYEIRKKKKSPSTPLGIFLQQTESVVLQNTFRNASSLLIYMTSSTKTAILAQLNYREESESPLHSVLI